MAQQMGIRSPLEPYLGLTLGGSGVNLMEITSAFGILANQGVRYEPYAIDKIVDDSGQEIYRQHPVKIDVLNRTTVDTMVKMMLAVVQRGTGQAANIGRQVAGKTGTSDDYRDAWFIGFTPDVVTGVWVGNDNNTTMRGMTGGSLPATIWRSYMKPYMANRPALPFDLAYSKALTEADFTTFDIKNLSDKDSHNNLATHERDGVMEQDPALEGTDPNNGEVLPDMPVDPANPQTGGESPSDTDNGNAAVEAPAPVTPPPTPRNSQPAQQQPMPGYGAPPPVPKAGYGVIPLERTRRSRIEPSEASNGIIPLPKGQ
jgi:penicillin-binding protein 1A